MHEHRPRLAELRTQPRLAVEEGDQPRHSSCIAQAPCHHRTVVFDNARERLGRYSHSAQRRDIRTDVDDAEQKAWQVRVVGRVGNQAWRCDWCGEGCVRVGVWQLWRGVVVDGWHTYVQYPVWHQAQVVQRRTCAERRH